MPTEEGGERKGPVPLTMQFRALEAEGFVFVVIFKDAKPAIVKVATDSYEALKKDISVSPFMKKFMADTAGKFQMVDATWGRNATIVLNTEKRAAQIKAAQAAQAEAEAAETAETPAEE